MGVGWGGGVISPLFYRFFTFAVTANTEDQLLRPEFSVFVEILFRGLQRAVSTPDPPPLPRAPPGVTNARWKLLSCCTVPMGSRCRGNGSQAVFGLAVVAAGNRGEVGVAGGVETPRRLLCCWPCFQSCLQERGNVAAAKAVAL